MRERMTREQREAQLIGIATTHFAHRGLNGTSIEEVAKAAGVSRPVIYDHFGDKEGMYLACVERARAQFSAVLTRVALDKNLPDLSTAAVRGADAYFALLEEDPDRAALLFSTGSAGTDKLRLQLRGLRDHNIDLIRAAIRRYHPEASDEQALVFAHAYVGLCDELGRWWMSTRAMPRERLLGYLAAFVSIPAAVRPLA